MDKNGLRKIPWSWGSKIVDQFRQDLLFEEADKFRGMLLDIGCGKKPYEPLLTQKVAQWIGIDLPVTHSGIPNAEIYASGMRLPFKDGVFDVVLCTEVLEHIPEPALLFCEMARVLHPGGLLLLTTPQAHVLHEAPHDYFRFTRYGLIHLAEKNGFSVEKVKAFGGVVSLIGQTIANHIPMIRPHRLGQTLRATLQAGVQWFFWNADKLLHRFHDGAEESTLGHLLVARKKELQ